MTRLTHPLLCSAVLSLILMTAQTARAQEIGLDLPRVLPIDETPLSTTLPRINVSLSGDVHGATPAGQRRKIADKRLAGLGVALFGAMTLDTYTTFKSTAWCPSCREGNPYAAPFVNRGPAVTYSTGLLFDTGVLGLSAAMRKSWNPAIRKIWWAPAMALVVGHGLASVNNLGLRNRCQREPRCGP